MIMFIKTNEDITINNTLGELHKYTYGSWGWIPELELSADTKYEIYETRDYNNECFITEYINDDKAKATYRVGVCKDDLLRNLSSRIEINEGDELDACFAYNEDYEDDYSRGR